MTPVGQGHTKGNNHGIEPAKPVSSGSGCVLKSTPLLTIAPSTTKANGEQLPPEIIDSICAVFPAVKRQKQDELQGLKPASNDQLCQASRESSSSAKVSDTPSHCQDILKQNTAASPISPRSRARRRAQNKWHVKSLLMVQRSRFCKQAHLALQRQAEQYERYIANLLKHSSLDPQCKRRDSTMSVDACRGEPHFTISQAAHDYTRRELERTRATNTSLTRDLDKAVALLEEHDNLWPTREDSNEDAKENHGGSAM